MEADQKAEIETQSCIDEEKKKDPEPELCMAAGIKTQFADKNQFQRRHFSEKTSSDIFFCGLPPEDHIASENGTDKVDSYLAAGSEMRKDDLKETEKRHFDFPSEDFITPENDADGTVETTEIEVGDADPKPPEKRHFHLPSEDDRDEQDDSAGTTELTEIETDNADQEQNQRRHFQGIPELEYIDFELMSVCLSVDTISHDEISRFKRISVTLLTPVITNHKNCTALGDIWHKCLEVIQFQFFLTLWPMGP